MKLKEIYIFALSFSILSCGSESKHNNHKQENNKQETIAEVDTKQISVDKPVPMYSFANSQYELKLPSDWSKDETKDITLFYKQLSPQKAVSLQILVTYNDKPVEKGIRNLLSKFSSVENGNLLDENINLYLEVVEIDERTFFKKNLLLSNPTWIQSFFYQKDKTLVQLMFFGSNSSLNRCKDDVAKIVKSFNLIEPK